MRSHRYFHHGVVAFNSEVERRVLLADLHLVTQVLVVYLRVNTHQHGHALVDLAALLTAEHEVLGEKQKIVVQVLSNCKRVKWLEEDFHDVAEGEHKDVELVNGLRGQARLGSFILSLIVLHG